MKTLKTIMVFLALSFIVAAFITFRQKPKADEQDKELARLNSEIISLRHKTEIVLQKKCFWVGACFGRGLISSNEVITEMGEANPFIK